MALPEDQLAELALLAFVARQRGWEDLADRIVEDISASRERLNRLSTLEKNQFDAGTEDRRAA